ncbi:MAG: universal stress protein [Rhizobiales bacterium]|nr:universal stress protein [Hyphomicrobiales bacterium]
MFKHIVVANDGSVSGFKALTMACELAKHHHSSLHMISVEELPDFPASIDEIVEAKAEENHKFHDVLEQARKIAKAKGINLKAEVVAGHAAASIVERVKAMKADLLIIGFTGHSPLYERIIGGTADRLVRLSACPVLVVK